VGVARCNYFLSGPKIGATIIGYRQTVKSGNTFKGVAISASLSGLVGNKLLNISNIRTRYQASLSGCLWASFGIIGSVQALKLPPQ